MKYLIISCSLNPESRSRKMAERVMKEMPSGESDYSDLAKYTLPLCDGSSSYGDPQVRELAEKISRADGLVVTTPVYNYDVSASTKNLLELTGSAWQDKVVGLLCSAGGHGSFMSPMGFLNSLVLDYHCHIVPRFVYATGRSFDTSGIVDEEVIARIEGFAREFVRVTRALSQSE